MTMLAYATSDVARECRLDLAQGTITPYLDVLTRDPGQIVKLLQAACRPDDIVSGQEPVR